LEEEIEIVKKSRETQIVTQQKTITTTETKKTEKFPYFSIHIL